MENIRIWFINFLEKVGIDKIAHFATGWALTCSGLLFGFLCGLVMCILTVMLTFLKEKYIDTEIDIEDAFYTFYGIFFAFAIYGVHQLLF